MRKKVHQQSVRSDCFGFYISLGYNPDLSRWVGLGVFLGILAGGLVKEEADVTELVKGLVSNEEPEPLSSL